MDIRKLESLSKLRLTEEEKETCTQELAAVVEYFHTLSALDTEGVAPLSHPFGVRNVLRGDTVQPSQAAKAVLQNAVSEDGCFVAPAAFEEG